MTATPEAEVARFRQLFARLEDEIARVIVGQRGAVRGVLAALAAGGHVLLEGVPGLGKTSLVRALARVTSLELKRIQFTPDLMPADITGTTVLVEKAGGGHSLEFERGPVFAHLVLADEINRATPKTQSALLEAMQEHSVTHAGVERALPEPFTVLATQNPLEMEGTYALPEAQLDRFLFKLEVELPELEDLVAIATRTTGELAAPPAQGATPEHVAWMRRVVRAMPVAPHVLRYAARIVLASHAAGAQAPPSVARFVRHGASPRGLQALLLGAKVGALVDGRYAASCSDVRRVAHPALRHRLLFNFEGQAEGVTPDAVIDELLARVPESE